MKISKSWYFEYGWNKVWILMSVLKRIDQYLLKNDLLIFYYFDIDWRRDYADMHYPSVEETREIIFFLQDLFALEVDKERTYPIARREIHAIWEIKIDKKLFNEVLNEVAKLTGAVIFSSETNHGSKISDKVTDLQYEDIPWPDNYTWVDENTYKLGDNGEIPFMPKEQNFIRTYFKMLTEAKTWVEIQKMAIKTGETPSQVMIKLNQIKIDKINNRELSKFISIEPRRDRSQPSAYRLIPQNI